MHPSAMPPLLHQHTSALAEGVLGGGAPASVLRSGATFSHCFFLGFSCASARASKLCKGRGGGGVGLGWCVWVGGWGWGGVGARLVKRMGCGHGPAAAVACAPAAGPGLTPGTGSSRPGGLPLAG